MRSAAARAVAGLARAGGRLRIATAEALALPLQLLVPERLQRTLGVTTFEAARRDMARRHLSGDLLDVGCGANRLAADHRRRGHRAYGCDPHPWNGIDVRADGAHLPFRDRSFDTVTMLACLNHIVDRASAVHEAARVLRPGGRLIVTMIPPLVGAVNHFVSWCDPDLRHRHHAAGERPGLSDAEVRSLARGAGLVLDQRSRFQLGMNSLYVYRLEDGR